MEWENFFRLLKTLNWSILLSMAVLSSLMGDPRFTFGILCGGLLITGNFHLLQHAVRKGFGNTGILRAKKGTLLVNYYLRLLGLGVVIFALIGLSWVDPVGLTIGLSTVVLAIIGAGIHVMRKPSSREAV